MRSQRNTGQSQSCGHQYAPKSSHAEIVSHDKLAPIGLSYSGVVKRKKEPQPQIIAEGTVVPDELLQQAKLASLDSERPRKLAPCVVCGGECSTASTEQLCWVCRRLKLSAWRDSDSQMPAQE